MYFCNSIVFYLFDYIINVVKINEFTIPPHLELVFYSSHINRLMQPLSKDNQVLNFKLIF